MQPRLSGFSLTELMTGLAIIGLIAAALIGVMTNLNRQSERMNTQTELLLAGRQIIGLIDPWAAFAGHPQRSPAVRRTHRCQNTARRPWSTAPAWPL